MPVLAGASPFQLNFGAKIAQMQRTAAFEEKSKDAARLRKHNAAGSPWREFAASSLHRSKPRQVHTDEMSPKVGLIVPFVGLFLAHWLDKSQSETYHSFFGTHQVPPCPTCR
jgi:hypothetical protein